MERHAGSGWDSPKFVKTKKLRDDMLLGLE